jgi:imidazoleglycerol phosphate synthase glutamine amidotransferase subunit HisH
MIELSITGGKSVQPEKCAGLSGLASVVTSSADEIRKADRLILPGVGAFPDAMKCWRLPAYGNDSARGGKKTAAGDLSGNADAF